MISLLPTTSPADTQGAFAILSLLTDDNKFKQRLNELIEAAKVAQQVLENASAKEKAATKLLQDAEARDKVAEDKIAKAGAVQRQAYADQDMLAKRAADLDALKAELLKKSDDAFAGRERANKEQEAAINKASATLAVDRQDFVTWVTQSKAEFLAIAEGHKNTTHALNIQVAELAQKHAVADELKRDLQYRLEKIKKIAGA